MQRQGATFPDFDVEVDKARFRASAPLPPADALRSLGNPQVLVVDEAQRLPEVSRIVKGWHDAHLPVRILLLGSSSLNLLDQAAESLTGRKPQADPATLVVLRDTLVAGVGDPGDTTQPPVPALCPAATGLAAATVGLRRLSRGRPGSRSGALTARAQRRLSVEGCPASRFGQDPGSDQTPAPAARPPSRLRGIGERVGNPAPDGAADSGALPGPARANLRHLPVAFIQHQPAQKDR